MSEENIKEEIKEIIKKIILSVRKDLIEFGLSPMKTFELTDKIVEEGKNLLDGLIEKDIKYIRDMRKSRW